MVMIAVKLWWVAVWTSEKVSEGGEGVGVGYVCPNSETLYVHFKWSFLGQIAFFGYIYWYFQPLLIKNLFNKLCGESFLTLRVVGLR